MYTLAPVGVDMVASGGGEKQMRSINPFKNSDVQACPNKVTWRNAITFLVCFAVPYLGHFSTPASPLLQGTIASFTSVATLDIHGEQLPALRQHRTFYPSRISSSVANTRQFTRNLAKNTSVMPMSPPMGSNSPPPSHVAAFAGTAAGDVACASFHAAVCPMHETPARYNV
jgi:hypothetical protein